MTTVITHTIFMGSGNRLKPAYTSPLAHSPGSRRDDTPQASMLGHCDGNAQTIPQRFVYDKQQSVLEY